MSKITKKITIEIEKHHGETFCAFELTIDETGKIDVSKAYNCTLADVEEDYIFGTKNELFRIQED